MQVDELDEVKVMLRTMLLVLQAEIKLSTLKNRWTLGTQTAAGGAKALVLVLDMHCDSNPDDIKTQRMVTDCTILLDKVKEMLVLSEQPPGSDFDITIPGDK